MKLFLSADIEGTAGIDTWDEATPGERMYPYFAAQMTREVAAACRAAGKLGLDVTVKDAHDIARNIDPSALPENASVLRGWIRDLYCMMGGLDRDSYEYVGFTGYHSDAVSDGNPLSHTMTTGLQRVMLNGKPASEFVLNAYMAGMLGIPVIFLSGDAALCASAKEMVPGITTVASKIGYGGGVIAPHPAKVCREIEEAMEHALRYAATPAGREACTVRMPSHFRMEATYKDWTSAYKYSFYPGAFAADAQTVVFETDDYMEMMRFMHFCI